MTATRSNDVPASLGIRVKSGTACAILLLGPRSGPRVSGRQTLDLCDPEVPASRQPYHAVMNAAASEAPGIEARLRSAVQGATRHSVEQSLGNARGDGLNIAACALVVGSVIDPKRIANEHIRAHAQEGQLFRTALVDAFQHYGISASVFVERAIYAQAADALAKPIDEIKRLLSALGKGSAGPWRADEKLAALAAWMTLPV
jgi:hypothetical protein